MGLIYMFANLNESYLPDLPGLEVKKDVIYDTEFALKAIEALCAEMENRLTDRQGSPDIVVVIDEYGIFVSSGFKSNAIMTNIIRLAQHGKDAGIHLLLSTSIPSVNIITGSIKANFPTRIAFRTMSRFDSQTFLDLQGAEKLTGNGDSLYLSGAELLRLQASYISEEEVCKICSLV